MSSFYTLLIVWSLPFIKQEIICLRHIPTFCKHSIWFGQGAEPGQSAQEPQQDAVSILWKSHRCVTETSPRSLWTRHQWAALVCLTLKGKLQAKVFPLLSHAAHICPDKLLLKLVEGTLTWPLSSRIKSLVRLFPWANKNMPMSIQRCKIDPLPFFL